MAGVLLIDHDVRGTEFQQVPYHRIFIMLFLELNAPDQILETINFQVRHGAPFLLCVIIFNSCVLLLIIGRFWFCKWLIQIDQQLPM